MKKPNIFFNLKLKSQGTTAILSSYQLLLNMYAQSKYANEITVKYVASKFTVPNKIVCWNAFICPYCVYGRMLVI